MPEWADVQLPPSSYDDKVSLQPKALFYIPSAHELMTERGHSTASLREQAAVYRREEQANGAAPRRPVIGANAITSVMNCRPVSYESAKLFVDLIGRMFPAENGSALLTTRQIIACVFRLKNLSESLKALSWTTDDLSRKSRINLNVVQTASSETARCQLHDALKIWETLSSAAREKKIKIEDLSEDPSDFIVTTIKPGRQANVQKFKENSRENYVYSRYDLTPAPLTGHPWALDPKPKP